MVHFEAPKLRLPRLLFVAVYTVALAYLVFVKKSLVNQLFLTDIGFAILFGAAVWAVARKASRPIDIALVASTSIVVLDSVTRAVFFTFFTNGSDDLGDFAHSIYNIEVSITTITVCMFFPFIALGASASAAIERHRTAAERDALTGLLNRRGFLPPSEKEANANALRGSVVVCDIDYFKRVNDTYGHGAGDRVLQGLANEMKRLFEALGRVARYGGEEFAAFRMPPSLKRLRLRSYCGSPLPTLGARKGSNRKLRSVVAYRRLEMARRHWTVPSTAPIPHSTPQSPPAETRSWLMRRNPQKQGLLAIPPCCRLLDTHRSCPAFRGYGGADEMTADILPPKEAHPRAGMGIQGCAYTLLLQGYRAWGHCHEWSGQPLRHPPGQRRQGVLRKSGDIGNAFCRGA
ncbi:GGDEF domain-containing protein [Rhizobium mongolense]|uniref:GGDEF domain-containing protein n=1 Tax=Rhizobium mongolense TaxID=57676 RepID=UPI003F609D8B